VERSAALALYEKVVAAMPGVERKGDTMPDALLAKTKDLLRFFQISFAYVGSLKPKPATTKKVSSPKKKPGQSRGPGGASR
jgi:hypothetical protein